MRHALILLSLFCIGSILYAMAPRLKLQYDNETSINQEFSNVYDNFNNISFRVVSSSPVVVSTGVINIDNGEIVIASSGTWAALYFRVKNRLFFQEFKLKQ